MKPKFIFMEAERLQLLEFLVKVERFAMDIDTCAEPYIDAHKNTAFQITSDVLPFYDMLGVTFCIFCNRDDLRENLYSSDNHDDTWCMDKELCVASNPGDPDKVPKPIRKRKNRSKEKGTL